MTPEHRQVISMLGNAGRLGAFCVWPLPLGMVPERNLIQPRLLVDGQEYGRPEMRPIEFVDPDWMAKGWAELEHGPPNEGCQETPYCPKGWCAGQGDCPWSRKTLGALRKAIGEEAADGEQGQ